MNHVSFSSGIPKTSFLQNSSTRPSYYALLGLAPFMVNSLFYYTFVSLFERRNIWLYDVLSSCLTNGCLYFSRYTVSFAVLIDMHIVGSLDLNLPNRILDGVIVAALISIAKIAIPTLISQLSYAEAPIGNFPVTWISVACAAAIGAYLPVSASRCLLHAKNILDRCLAGVRRLS
jgi:hypothetical protein